ncbi:unnamed protein product [Owenia fusiformis]|uniref:Sulfotransferase domain-containing protein n=1 Tax=Owenia fusiformis TaxID=6347 RepID=A0A8J1U946_OWEFU|nr:unnamed protein product [Owenia fusiformis]
MAELNYAVGGIFDDIVVTKGTPTIIKDDLGEPFPVHIVDGFTYPQNIRQTVHDEMKDFKVRADDIWLFSYPRSGQHWTWNIVYRLTHDLQEAPKGMEAFCMPELVPHDVISSVPSPRIIRTHQLPSSIPKTVWDKCKMINIVRHPKDAAYSFYKHQTAALYYGYNGTWEGYLPMWLRGEVAWNDWFKHVQEYKKLAENVDMLFLTYEETKNDTIGTIKKIADYIGVSWSEEDYKKIIDETKIDVMQSRNKTYDAYARDGRGADGMFRKGVVGAWKEHFTVAQNELFNKVYKERMKGIPFVYDDLLDS